MHVLMLCFRIMTPYFSKVVIIKHVLIFSAAQWEAFCEKCLVSPRDVHPRVQQIGNKICVLNAEVLHFFTVLNN